MQSRMKNPALLFPDAMKALQALHASTAQAGIPATTFELMSLRASQINGCGVCCDMHPKILKKLGETDARILGVAAWREMPYYTDAERAALALTEAVTRIADREDPVPDAVWQRAAEHYDETKMAALLLAIAGINVWNRLNAATRQIAGQSGWEA
ncbi:MAG TPA: carboxymuconolactone decarboxylase family protein [Polyangiaceae bacterium]